MFLRQLQLVTSQIPFEILCSLYLEHHPQPPRDLEEIVEAILAAAGT